MGYDKLERNLIDIIKEEQAKLGFFREDIQNTQKKLHVYGY